MSFQPVTRPTPDVTKSYISLPPETSRRDEPFFPAKFVIFAVLVIGAAATAGSLQSGRISLNRFFNVPASAPAAPHPAFHTAPATATAPASTAAPVPTLKPDTFVVTSISIGQPSIAIINGTSHIQGDPLQAPGVTGWKVGQIVDGAVILENGATVATIPLSAPAIKPLDDTLHPLN